MKILVTFHIYYEDQIPWFIDKMKNLEGWDWDLIVTGNSLSEGTREELVRFRPDVRFIETDKAGYDVWPFLQAVRQTDLSPYDLVIKLHTKNTSGDPGVRINSFTMEGFEWRDTLVDSMLKDKGRVDKLIGMFEKSSATGMVCASKLYTRVHSPEDCKMLENEIARIGMTTRERRFCAGTMFAIRTSLLEPLKTYKLDASMFPSQVKTHGGGTMAHVYERILSLLAPNQGYKVKFTDLDPGVWCVLFFRRYILSVAREIFSIEHRGDDWGKYLTIFGLSFRLDEKPRGQN